MLCLTDGAVKMQITVLFARKDSLYKRWMGVEVYDEQRNALSFVGQGPVICHPPCREWGRLRQFSKAPPGERELAIWAVSVVRSNGGVLEHPASSTLWDAMNMPKPGQGKDAWGGWTLEIAQCDFGHPAEKLTWLYIVGTEKIPPLPPTRKPTHVVKSAKREHLPICTHKWREQTPIYLTFWLIVLCSFAITK